MEKADIIRLVIAIILGYTCIFATMWLFRVRTKKENKPKHLNTKEIIIDNATRNNETNNTTEVPTGHI